MNILIADDHVIIREGLLRFLQNFPAVSKVDQAGDGNEALDKIRQMAYDLVILDISMPGMSGLDILQQIKRSGIDSRVLILSFHDEHQYASRAFSLGASGYIKKSASYDDIREAITRVAAGGKYVSPGLAEKLAFGNMEIAGKLPHEKLSEREFQVMLLLSKGQSVKEIAVQTYISDKTVSTYRTRIMKKMGVSTNADLVLYSYKNELIK